VELHEVITNVYANEAIVRNDFPHYIYSLREVK